ncbi:Cytidylate kinase [compost metagenome]
MEQLIADMSERDRLDQEREISPLRQAEDAVLLDTTNMTLEEVVESIVSMCRTFVRERELG